MSFIKGETKYDDFKLEFKEGDQRDYERALAKLLKIWDNCQYFYDASNTKPYVSEKNKDIVNLSDDEVAKLPEPFRKEAEKARSDYLRTLEEYAEMAQDYALVKLLVSQKTPEEGLVAVEKKYGKDKRGRSKVCGIAEKYQDHEYQEWRVERKTSPISTETWDY